MESMQGFWEPWSLEWEGGPKSAFQKESKKRCNQATDTQMNAGTWVTWWRGTSKVKEGTEVIPDSKCEHQD